MIKITLNELAKKLNKNISDIAKETGLNRNTVTTLFHNKVDGIKFETLEKICQVYKVKIDDILKLETESSYQKKVEKFYRQEGEAVPFTAWPVGLQICKLNQNYFKNNYGFVGGFWKENYMMAFFKTNKTEILASEVYERYSKKAEVDKLFVAYEKESLPLQEIYLNRQLIASLNKGQFLEFFNKLRAAYARFWAMSIFIDSFDAGYDQKKLKELSEINHLSLDDISFLTTPSRMTFNNERLLNIYELAINYKGQKKYETIVDFVEYDMRVEDYIKKFDYYQYNYSHIKHITKKEIVNEIEKLLKDEKEFERNYKELKNFTKDKEKEIGLFLKKRKLKENPLYFFQVLTYWREHRKMVNLMGIHQLFAVLEYLEKHSGIKLEYLKHLTTDEVEALLSGSITKEVLERRYIEGIFASFDRNGYKIVVGQEAQSLLDQHNDNPANEETKVLSGQVASQGYSRGKARVILGVADFNKFQEGEILVTGMTRPEFLPIMKMSAAIVTNEGGITCHAAIVSRELGKPCIIGTKNATQVIKDGDLIEVRANHGTVRILS